MAILEDQVLASLRRIIRATDIHSRRLNKDTGLTTPQLVVVRAIAAGDSLTASEIARAVSLSQATVTTLLNRLEDRGLIARQRSEEDRRRVNVQLTKAGRALVATAPEPLQEQFAARFAQLEAWEQHQLVASLERVANMMDAEDLDAAPLLAPGEDVG
ncbi:MAG: MarR family transcriptional regulator [Halieaceae bacterium]|nr:MarR family transcriptional regulator [Halieaceae bacterium]